MTSYMYPQTLPYNESMSLIKKRETTPFGSKLFTQFEIINFPTFLYRCAMQSMTGKRIWFEKNSIEPNYSGLLEDEYLKEQSEFFARKLIWC